MLHWCFGIDPCCVALIIMFVYFMGLVTWWPYAFWLLFHCEIFALMEVYPCVLQNKFAEIFKCSFLRLPWSCQGTSPILLQKDSVAASGLAWNRVLFKVVVFEGHRSKSALQVCLENSMVNGEFLQCSATTDPADVELVCRDIALQKNSRGPGSRSRLLNTSWSEKNNPRI